MSPQSKLSLCISEFLNRTSIYFNIFEVIKKTNIVAKSLKLFI